MVYFIYNSTWNVMKIGYSAEPEKRLKQIQTACPMPLILRGVECFDFHWLDHLEDERAQES